ncbi:hypothetical protein, partial [Methylobacter sp.]|uniref:hypothetical protein n=1 Tax=Methylobacter sp. TaxID=2051955 RepID=UPI0025EFD5F8
KISHQAKNIYQANPFFNKSSKNESEDKLSLKSPVCFYTAWVDFGLLRMTKFGHVRSVTEAGPMTAFTRKADVMDNDSQR